MRHLRDSTLKNQAILRQGDPVLKNTLARQWSKQRNESANSKPFHKMLATFYKKPKFYNKIEQDVTSMARIKEKTPGELLNSIRKREEGQASESKNTEKKK